MDMIEMRREIIAILATDTNLEEGARIDVASKIVKKINKSPDALGNPVEFVFGDGVKKTGTQVIGQFLCLHVPLGQGSGFAGRTKIIRVVDYRVGRFYVAEDEFGKQHFIREHDVRPADQYELRMQMERMWEANKNTDTEQEDDHDDPEY